jgi:RNA polymerase sigma-70 factor, ECF subfamily
MPEHHEPLETALILRALSDRDDVAFGRLVALHQSRVRAFLQRLCRDTALADDLAQETFLTAYQKLASYQGRGSFNGWLCSIAYRCFLQYQRRQRRNQSIRQQIEQQIAIEQQPDPARYEVISPGHLDLERALLLIERVEAAAITLNYSLGFSHNEVASIMQLPLGTVKSHITRGIGRLRAILTEPKTEQTS